MAGRVHRLEIPTPFPVGPVNLYLIEGREPTLIDTGPNTPEAWDGLVQGLRGLGATVDQIRHIIITHGHADHYGLAGRIAAESGALVWVHQGDRDIIQDYPLALHAWLDFLRSFLPETGLEHTWIERFCRSIEKREGCAAPVPAARLLHDGQRLELNGTVLTVIHTPGHSPGSICLYSGAEQLLFAGDHLLKTITPNPILQAFPDFFGIRFQGLVHYFDSLKKLEPFPIARILPGHGEEITDRDTRLREIREHSEKRKARLLDLLKQRELTIMQAKEGLFPNLPDGQTLLALFDVIGHLDLLQRDGAIRIERRGGLLFAKAT
jgi:glyoxylase-like metal-dependent hydrolase (beta-lactamase superfamily II)